jgi:HK97 family phage major capsid protein
MQSIQALRERLSVLAQSTRKLVEDNNDKWTAELGEQYDAKMNEIEDVKAQIGRVQATLDAMADDKIDGQVFNAAAAKAPASERAIFNKWLRKGDSAVTAEEWAIVRNTMSTTTAGEGGYTVPTEISSMLIDALKKFGGMRSAATVITTAQGQPDELPGLGRHV